MSVTLNDLTKYVKMNTHFPKNRLDINEHFSQPNVIPVNLMDDRHNLNHSVSIVEKSIEYKENEIIEIPATLGDILDLNNYYLFCCFNLLDSILMSIDDTHKLKSVNDKKESIQEFVCKLRDTLDNIYKEEPEYYDKLKIKKSKLDSELNNGIFNSYLLKLVSFLTNVNIMVLNIEKNIYMNFTCKNNEDNYIVLIDIDSHFIPLIHIYNYKFNKSDIEKIIPNFKMNLYLKSVSNYTLKQIQELAQEYNLSIFNEDTKKKTKQNLYDELQLKFSII